MKKLLLLICFIFIQVPVISYDNTDFSNTLGWEKKWNKVIIRSTEKYLSKIEKGPFSKLSINDRDSAISEMRESLQEKLSWEVMGQGLTQGIIKHCDPEILNIMTRFYKKERVLNVERKLVVKEYSICAKKGFSESMVKLKEVIISSVPEVDKVLNKYK